MMNKRSNVTARFATGDTARYLKALNAEGSHMRLESGVSDILLRSDVATRRTAFHEWLHRRLQLRNGQPLPGEDAIIERFLSRHERLFRLND